MANATTQPNPWSNHAGYDLTRYAMTAEQLNDHDRYHTNLIEGSVKATKFTGQEIAFIDMSLTCGPTGMSVRMSPDNARTLAQALADAADIVDQFTIHQAEEAELARFNAGPINRIELPGGVVAFEPVAEGGAA
jgi:hypothetical protein